MFFRKRFADHYFIFSALLALLPAFLTISSCSKKESKGSNSANTTKSSAIGLSVELSTALPAAGNDVTIELVGQQSVSEVIWDIFKVEGENKKSSGTCLQTEILKTTCNFENAGNYVVVATVKMYDGRILHLEKTFIVSEPVGISNQSPIIVLKITSGLNEATVATFHQEESGEAVFPKGSVISFDFSGTRDDETPAASIIYEMSIGDGVFETLAGVVSTKTFANVGKNIITVRATDANGNKTEKSFQLFITCDSSVPDLTLNSDVINIAPSTLGFNWHKYTATNVLVSGGSGPFKYMWDFNGDDTYDTQWLASSDLPYDVFTTHQNSRKIKVKVWDSECQFVKVAEKTLNFDWSSVFAKYASEAELDAGPKTPSYYYVQGSLKSSASPINPAINVDHWAGDLQGAPILPKRVQCKYNRKKQGEQAAQITLDKGAFWIQGEERYISPEEGRIDPNTYKPDGLFHGIEININDIIDDTTKGGRKPLTGEKFSSVFSTHEVNFYTDRMSDVTKERTFTKTEDCPIRMRVEVITDGVPCSPIATEDGSKAQQGYTYGVKVWGDYNCPSMKSEKDEVAKIEDGAFYCEELKVDACYGGCCCCCGGIPPVPR